MSIVDIYENTRVMMIFVGDDGKSCLSVVGCCHAWHDGMLYC